MKDQDFQKLGENFQVQRVHPMPSLGFSVSPLLVFFFKTRFLYVALEPVLELALQIRLASNSQRSTCFCLSSAGIKGVRHLGKHPSLVLISSSFQKVSQLLSTPERVFATFYFIYLFVCLFIGLCNFMHKVDPSFCGTQNTQSEEPSLR